MTFQMCMFSAYDIVWTHFHEVYKDVAICISVVVQFVTKPCEAYASLTFDFMMLNRHRDLHFRWEYNTVPNLNFRKSERDGETYGRTDGVQYIINVASYGEGHIRITSASFVGGCDTFVWERAI